MKKVLFITYYWPPSGGSGVQRPLKFVKYLQQYGWMPVVYTSKGGEYFEIDHSLEAEVPKNIKILKTKPTEPYALFKMITGKKKDDKLVAGYMHQKKSNSWAEKLSMWVRSNLFVPDARMLWISPSVHYLSKYIAKHQINAIVTTGPPHSMHLIGMALKKKHHIPWLADFRDPWTQIDYWEDLKMTDWVRNMHIKLEKMVLQTADKVVCVSRTWGQGLENNSGIHVDIISNGFDEEDIQHTQNVSRDTQFSLVHIGMMGKSRNHEVFWQAVSSVCAEDEDIKKDLIVKLYGKNDPSVIESIAKYNLNKQVEIYPYIPHYEIVGIQQKAQVLYLSVNRTANAQGILTGKIYEYLAARRPILCIGPVSGEAAQVIYDTNTGLVSDFDDLTALKANIRTLYQHYKEHKDYVKFSNIEIYSRKYQTKQLAELLNCISP
ncbi:MAG: glycosyltransferase [Cytophagales bacterium]|nr:glycosyltransferase [Cytophagales bacterium]